ncbi:right-handed parallel beta-helix repeat-containing protein [Rhodopirellula sp. ICT_H3.1]|uniref:Right-handed parallel beta-helix repeat-containing protein n=1 Tax=Aporhodopirellula aestuarii TaxID=2950107 RepID=A0ABT0U5S5_9BACT|nr:right-handed parallel beta-helix repeat-containing protein [Aporhodopirellula aestuarii]
MNSTAKFSTITQSALILLAIICVPRLVSAAEIYLTPHGAGRNDGTSWENAFDQDSLSSVVNETMEAGDRLLLGGGTYRDVRLTISSGGVPGSPKTIVGVDRGEGLPVFVSSWSEEKPDKGATAVRIEPGVGHVVFEGLRIEDYEICVLVPAAKNGASCEQLVFNDVDMKRFRHGFYLSDCDNLRLQDCDLRRYTKHGFRFDQGCNRVVVRRCTADCSEGDSDWETKTELFPFGFIVNNGGAANTEFLFEDCLARNNRMPLQKKRYKNGDGFVVEGNASDVRFVCCRAIRNQDGGFDLKVNDVRLVDCVALGNSRNIRIWKAATLENCFSGWASCGLWCNGGPIMVHRTTFHELRQAAVQTDDQAREPVTLSECLVSSCGQVHRKTARGKVVLNETTVVEEDAGQSPDYVQPSPDWDGLGDLLNSRTHPNIGYHRSRSSNATR